LGPNRPILREASTIIPIMISTVIGSSAEPLGKALQPSTCCR